MRRDVIYLFTIAGLLLVIVIMRGCHKGRGAKCVETSDTITITTVDTVYHDPKPKAFKVKAPKPIFTSELKDTGVVFVTPQDTLTKTYADTTKNEEGIFWWSAKTKGYLLEHDFGYSITAPKEIRTTTTTTITNVIKPRMFGLYATGGGVWNKQTKQADFNAGATVTIKRILIGYDYQVISREQSVRFGYNFIPPKR